MKPTFTRRAAALAAFVAVVLLFCAGWISYAQTTGPTITIGLANPTNFSKILPLSDTVTQGKMGTRYAGKVVFRAEVTGTSLERETITIPRASGAAYHSPTSHTFIGVGWDTRTAVNGTSITVTVTASDQAGHVSVASRTVTLKK
jgi:hypothetical protein